MSRIRTLAVAGLTLLVGLPAAAKIRVADSVEWWCHSAEEVVSGVLIAVDGPPKGERLGKSRELVSLTLQVPAVGKQPARQVDFSMRLADSGPLRRLLEKKTMVVAFLRSTEQGYSKGGRSYHHWPVRDKNGRQLVFDPTADEPLTLLAEAMRRPKNVAEVTAACRRIHAAKAALGQAPKGRPDPRMEPHLLETPWESEAGKLLYSGSASYLTVPGYAFPKSRKNL